MVELLKQGQYQPMPVEQQVISIWAGGNGFLDRIPVSDVRRFERELLEFMEANHPEIGRHIREQGTLPDEVESELREAVTELGRRFRSSDGQPAVKDEPVEPMGPDEEGQESVRAYRRDTPEEYGKKAGPAGQGASGTP
jgi:F-type H+-transporting ATPase subunit alpha